MIKRSSISLPNMLKSQIIVTQTFISTDIWAATLEVVTHTEKFNCLFYQS